MLTRWTVDPARWLQGTAMVFLCFNQSFPKRPTESLQPGQVWHVITSCFIGLRNQIPPKTHLNEFRHCSNHTYWNVNMYICISAYDIPIIFIYWLRFFNFSIQYDISITTSSCPFESYMCFNYDLLITAYLTHNVLITTWRSQYEDLQYHAVLSR